MKNNIKKILKKSPSKLEEYIKNNIDNLNFEEVIELLKYSTFNKEISNKLLNKINDNLAVQLAANDEFYDSFKVLSYYFPEQVKITISGKDWNSGCINNAIRYIIESDKYVKIKLSRLIKFIQNKSVFFEMLIDNSTLSILDKKEIFEYLLLDSEDVVDDEVAVLLAPYLLNNDYYITFISNVKNLAPLKLPVIATKNKNIIAYYILNAKDYDLLEKTFENDRNYIDYCSKVFSVDTLNEVEEFIRLDYNYKYVDANVDKLLNSPNEKIDMKFY